MFPRQIGFIALAALLSTPLIHGCVGDEPASANPKTGVEDGGNGNGNGNGSDSGSPDLDADAAPPAGCPLGCLPPAPAGWTGPSAVYDGVPASKPAGCPSTLYTQLEVEGHQGMTAPAAECSCGTAQVQGASCSASVQGWGAGCSSGLPLLVGSASSNGGCLVSSDGTSANLKVTTPTINRGTCAYPAPQVTRKSATFEKVNVACGLPQLGACEGRADCTATPLPEAPFTRLCLHKEGDHSCPSADYSKRSLVFKKVTDSRDCSACVGTPSGGACGSNWGFSPNDPQCTSGIPPTTHAAGACVSNPGIGARINVGAMAPSGITCNQTGGGTPTGGTVSEEPVTFCCNK